MSFDPFTTPRVWDTFVVGGIPTPGKCEVSFKRSYGWDRKKGKGAAGETVTFSNKPAAEIKVKFWLWEVAHFAEWSAIFEILKYRPEKGVPTMAINVFHPTLAMLDIANVVVWHIGAIEHQGEGEYTLEIEFLEWNPPPPISAVSTPLQSADAGLPDAVAPDPQIDALRAQFAESAAQAQQAYAK